jgi:excisionase family DNA binding protein
MNRRPLLHMKDVQARLDLGEKTVRGFIARGELPAMKLGRVWRIDEDDLTKFEDACRQAAMAVPPQVAKPSVRALQQRHGNRLSWAGTDRYRSGATQ